MDNHPSALEDITDDVSIYMAGHFQHKLFDLLNDYPAKSILHVLFPPTAIGSKAK